MRPIVVIDDDQERAREEWRPAIQAATNSQVQVVTPSDFARDLAVLEKRRKAARDGGVVSEDAPSFDSAGILVVDYDLFDFDAKVDGDGVAYLARCYSSCGLIVGVNQDLTERWFDLTLLDHPQTFTDLSVGAAHLGLRSLWTSTPTDGDFSPWSWPHLLAAAKAFEECVNHVEFRTGEGALEVLGISETQAAGIPRSLLSLLQMPVVDPGPSRVGTVDQVVSGSPMGRMSAKDVIPDAFVPRVAAARLRKWLEVCVLARQDILVDAPHLVARIPGLSEVPPEEWVQLCARHVEHSAVPLVDVPDLVDSRFVPAVPWLSRPTWWIADVQSTRALDRFRDLTLEASDLVFCEDTSSFEPIERAVRVSTAVDGNYPQRWVAMPRDNANRLVADYEPAVRLAGLWE